MNVTKQKLPGLITALLQPRAYAHEVQSIEIIETHISWVILTGAFAYKIKKPVNFGFLDFSSLEKRHYCCNEELRLNSRLAPSIYLEVAAITGSAQQPVVSGQGPAIEYAIKMRQFPQSMQLDHMLERGELNSEHMDIIARMIANFHRQTDIAGNESAYGNPAAVYMPVEENFSQIREHIREHARAPEYLDRLASLEDWSRTTYSSVSPLLEQRKQQGFVRECHGDMHLRNLVWYEDAPVAFDCIEFNPNFRWIDVISEVAFLVMDLEDRQQYKLAARFLNSYLEITGDYPAVRLMPFYCCYRAMVRAKVAALRLSQPGITHKQREGVENEFLIYLVLAENYTQKREPELIITFGMSASGKSTVSQQLLESLPAIRIRSDVERKRIHDLDAHQDAQQNIEQGIYSQLASQQTYNSLVELAAYVLDAGYTVIIDAANLKQEQRMVFQHLAKQKGVPYIILEFKASPDALRKRIRDRKKGVSDADLSVLEHQLLNYLPLDESEKPFALIIDTESAIDIDALAGQLASAQV